MKRARDLSHLLFSLSRHSLPDVRWNHYWPEVAREINRRTGRSIGSDHIASFFRSILDTAYHKDIKRFEKDNIHHKYVGLVFEQAGIGKDRTIVIREYLMALLRLVNTKEIPRSEDIFVLDALKVFVAEVRAERRTYVTDVEPLTRVLLDVGRAVLHFRDFISDLPDRWTLASWPWERISEIWKETSGIDPDKLTPSARDVLSGIVQQLAGSITRAEAYRRIRDGSLSLALPGGAEATEIPRSSAIPIGSAEVLGPFGRWPIILVDDADYLPERLVTLSRNTWHKIGENFYFRVSLSPFSEISPSGYRISSVPIHVRSKSGVFQEIGHYWGFEFPPGESPEDHDASDRLRLIHSLRITPTGITLLIEKVSVLSGNNLSGCELTVGSKKIWSGDLESGTPLAWSKTEVPLTEADVAGGRTAVTLVSQDGRRYLQTISLVMLRQPAILTVRSKSIRPHTTTTVDFRHLMPNGQVFLYTRGTQTVSIEGAELRPTGKANFVGHEFDRHELVMEDLKAAVTLKVCGREWHIVPLVRFDVSLEGPDKIGLDDVVLQGVGSVRPVSRGSWPNVLIRPLDGPSALPGFLQLHLRLDGYVKFPISPEDLARREGGWVFSLGKHMEKFDIQVFECELTFGIASGDEAPDRWFTLVIFNGAPEIVPARFGQKAMLRIGNSDRPAEVQSESVITQASVEEGKLVNGIRRMEHGELWFTWKPVVIDAVLDGKTGLECGYTVSAADLSDGNPELSVYGREGVSWTIRASGIESESSTIRKISLVPLFEHFRNNIGSQSEEQIECICDAERIVWTVIDRPQVLKPECRWDGDGSAGQSSVVIDCEFRGFLPEDLLIVVRLATLEMGKEHVRVLGHGIATSRLKTAVPVVINAFEGEVVGEALVEFWCRDRALQSQVVTGKSGTSASHDPAVLKQDVRFALREFKRTSQTRFAELALSQIALYAAIHGELPYREAELLAPVGNVGPSAAAGVVELLQGCIRLISCALAENPGIPIELPLQISDSDLLKAIGATLVVFQQDRLGQRGLLVPEKVVDACNVLARTDEHATGTNLRAWCKAVREFGEAMLVEHRDKGVGSPGADSRTNAEDFEMVRQQHLSRIHPRFSQWIDHKCRGIEQ
ncbi:MAG: hypothetical protein ACYC1T_06890 [Sulfuricaulis sp.]